MSEDITKLDLYGILGIAPDAEEQEIRKAYRKNALTCHPDKNPDNPKAAEEFQKLSKVFEVLIDSSTRAAYDRVLKARQATELRNRQLDSKRRKLKDDLEARERDAHQKFAEEVDVNIRLAREIERLRKEGSEQLQRENELMKKQIAEEIRQMKEQEQSNLPRLKVKWNRKLVTYDDDTLSKLLSQYGAINCLVLSKKGNSAIVEFKKTESALKAVENETSELMTFEWLQGKPVFSPRVEEPASQSNPSTMPGTQNMPTSKVGNLEDFENQVLQRLRQAQERKRLEEQIKQQEESAS